MTLELLFAQANQGRTFLLMALCGCLGGIAAVLAGLLHRRSKAAGLLADGVIALLLTISAAYISFTAAKACGSMLCWACASAARQAAPACICSSEHDAANFPPFPGRKAPLPCRILLNTSKQGGEQHGARGS